MNSSFATPRYPRAPNTTPTSGRLQRVPRAPINNPYDQFTKSDFDAFINDITSKLKSALGHGDPLEAKLKACETPQPYVNGHAGEENEDEFVDDSFAEVKARRLAKGKQRATEFEEQEEEFGYEGEDFEVDEEAEEEYTDEEEYEEYDDDDEAEVAEAEAEAEFEAEDAEEDAEAEAQLGDATLKDLWGEGPDDDEVDYDQHEEHFDEGSGDEDGGHDDDQSQQADVIELISDDDEESVDVVKHADAERPLQYDSQSLIYDEYDEDAEEEADELFDDDDEEQAGEDHDCMFFC